MLKNKILSAVGGEAKLYVDDLFQTWVSTGNGSSRTVTGPDMTKGGLSITKSRSTATGWHFVDTARGAGNSLSSNSTAASVSETTGLTAFTSTGTTIGSAAEYNTSGNTYVDYLFRRAQKFFDVVTYTGNGVAGRQIPHSLGVAPGMIIVKRTDSTSNWVVYHQTQGNGAFLRLNTTDLVQTGNNIWNYETPTSTIFTIGNDAGVNASGATYVAYLFANDPEV